jgi:WD40 repeat protein
MTNTYLNRLAIILFSVIAFIPLWLNNELSAQTDSHPAYVSWSPDGVMLAVAATNRVDIVEVDSMSVMNSITNVKIVDDTQSSPAWSSNGDMLAIADGPDIQIWSQSWSPLEAQQMMTYKYYENEPRSDISSMAWSPDDNEMAIAVGEFVFTWEVSSGNSLGTFWDEWGYILDIAWNDDRIAIATTRTFAVNLDPATGEIINYYAIFGDEPGINAFTAIDFSPDGNQMVIANNNGSIDVWGDARTAEDYSGTPRMRFQYGDVLNDVDWSPDGAYIASAGADGNVKIWDAETGELIQTIEVGENMNSVAWSPDGSQLAYGTATRMGVEIVPAPAV